VISKSEEGKEKRRSRKKQGRWRRVGLGCFRDVCKHKNKDFHERSERKDRGEVLYNKLQDGVGKGWAGMMLAYTANLKGGLPAYAHNGLDGGRGGRRDAEIS